MPEQVGETEYEDANVFLAIQEIEEQEELAQRER